MKYIKYFENVDPFDDWDDMENDYKIKRCGSCGDIIDEHGYSVTDINILNNLSDDDINDLELDQCYNCAMGQQTTNDRGGGYVTRDMASDAGNPELEGMPC